MLRTSRRIALLSHQIELGRCMQQKVLAPAITSQEAAAELPDMLPPLRDSIAEVLSSEHRSISMKQQVVFLCRPSGAVFAGFQDGFWYGFYLSVLLPDATVRNGVRSRREPARPQSMLALASGPSLWLTWLRNGQLTWALQG